MSMLILKGIQCVMSVTHPMPDKELQWKRSPHLPSQEMRSHHKKSKSDKTKNSWRKRQEKQPLAHAEIPLESVFIEEIDAVSVEIPPERNSDINYRLDGNGRHERSVDRERVDSRATMV
ncbi:uncharacterized protein LOC128959736 isoform X2 [Oppia nitens]|nr:uncharacterized protein LOC128959736 isoform X2 [Oppia nitens]